MQQRAVPGTPERIRHGADEDEAEQLQPTSSAPPATAVPLLQQSLGATHAAMSIRTPTVARFPISARMASLQQKEQEDSSSLSIHMQLHSTDAAGFNSRSALSFMQQPLGIPSTRHTPSVQTHSIASTDTGSAIRNESQRRSHSHFSASPFLHMPISGSSNDPSPFIPSSRISREDTAVSPAAASQNDITLHSRWQGGPTHLQLPLDSSPPSDGSMSLALPADASPMTSAMILPSPLAAPAPPPPISPTSAMVSADEQLMRTSSVEKRKAHSRQASHQSQLLELALNTTVAPSPRAEDSGHRRAAVADSSRNHSAKHDLPLSPSHGHSRSHSHSENKVLRIDVHEPTERFAVRVTAPQPASDPHALSASWKHRLAQKPIDPVVAASDESEGESDNDFSVGGASAVYSPLPYGEGDFMPSTSAAQRADTRPMFAPMQKQQGEISFAPSTTSPAFSQRVRSTRRGCCASVQHSVCTRWGFSPIFSLLFAVVLIGLMLAVFLTGYNSIKNMVNDLSDDIKAEVLEQISTDVRHRLTHQTCTGRQAGNAED